MVRQPLFVRFVNGELGPTEVMALVRRSLPEGDPRTAYTLESIEYLTSEGLKTNIDLFRSDFKELLADVVDGGFSKEVTTYLSSYTSSSLEEFEETEKFGSGGGSSRFAVVKDKDAPWIEGYICYNFMLYVKGFGRAELKSCKACSKYFTGHGKYASYCTELCKTGVKRKERLS